MVKEQFMSENNQKRRLTDLVENPRETPDVELKDWLDLRGSQEHKAQLAKALLALANHGGGYLLIGFEDGPDPKRSERDEPSTLDGYSQDIINGIVQSYADPPFHCAVEHVVHSSGKSHPVVIVPGMHRVPIRAKRSGPDKKYVIENTIYIRRPGPRSEAPQSGREWDEVLARCLAARKDEFLTTIRNIVTGHVAESPLPDTNAALNGWIEESVETWRNLVSGLPQDDSRRCPHGYYWIAYEIEGDFPHPTNGDLLEKLSRSTSELSGWSPWWVPTSKEIMPYPKGGVIECWLGRDHDRHFSDAPHADFWRISSKGRGFLLRGYDEDGDWAQSRGFEQGTVFDLATPIRKIGESIINASLLAKNLGSTNTIISFQVEYSGLAGRKLTSVSGDRRLWQQIEAQENTIRLSTTVPLEAIDDNLVEILRPLLAPLYQCFSFFELKPDLVQTEVSRLKKGGF
jgi:hypothetical protein